VIDEPIADDYLYPPHIFEIVDQERVQEQPVFVYTETVAENV
jgi:hypothetical protein